MMKVLLINTNHVIAELFNIAKKDSNHKFIQDTQVSQDADIFVVNALDCNEEILSQIGEKPCILLVSKQDTKEYRAKNIYTLEKPFLPSDLLEKIDSVGFGGNQNIFSKSDMQKLQKLLRGNGDDKPMDNVTYVFNKQARFDENRIVEKLLNLKPKKLKKLLGSAKVTLNIEFKD